MFKPMLILNDEIDIRKIPYPQLASLKLDGLRLFVDLDLLSRSLKLIPNKQVRSKFEFLKKYSIEYNVILDGEIYCKEIPFQMISSMVMTDDYTAPKSIKAWDKLCKKHHVNVTREQALEYLKFYCFDIIVNKKLTDEFETRSYLVENIKINDFNNNQYFVVVKQILVHTPEEVEKFFEEAIELGYEGLVVKNPKGEYKCGRTTFNENLAYKVKLFVTIDGQIIGVVQATQVKEGVARTINELGRSVTSKKLGDREAIESASGFIILYKGRDYVINLKMSAEEKEEIWKHQSEFIGKWVEYKCMEYGMKTDGLPRHGKTNQTFETIRMRYDKQDEDSEGQQMIDREIERY